MASMNLHPLRTLFLLAATAACGSSAGDDSDHEEAGVPTESVCPTTQTLTYENFGQDFFDSYCQRCHGGTVAGADRNGAPSDHTFDTVEHIRTFADHIDERAAAGPAGVNTIMPPEGEAPTEAERTQLGEWLACGAP